MIQTGKAIFSILGVLFNIVVCYYGVLITCYNKINIKISEFFLDNDIILCYNIKIIKYFNYGVRKRV
jgi:hypothetical protein